MTESYHKLNWTREELILALDLYFRVTPRRVSAQDPEIVELSEFLRALPIHPNTLRDEKFRNPNGVHKKLQNFLRLDPTYGGKGLQAGSKLDEDVWEEFASDRNHLRKTAAAIYRKYMKYMMKSNYMSYAMQELIIRAHQVSEDVATEVEKTLQEALENPLSKEELSLLFSKIAEVIKARAIASGDIKTAESVDKDIEGLLEEVLVNRSQDDQTIRRSSPSRAHTVRLLEYDGIPVGPVRPTPWFHERQVPMVQGHVNTAEIDLWGGNKRLSLHIWMFKEKYGRNPSSQELIDIMTTKLKLPAATLKDPARKGIDPNDRFRIRGLARSIAINGVRKPPIIDIDGTLIDGNRRLAACYLILSSDEFDSNQKRNAQKIFVWQLTPHATEEDRRRVEVSLNFEEDYKEKWSEYIRARTVVEEWSEMLDAGLRTAGPKRQREMKKELSKKYALGPNATEVTRYIRMVEWTNEFEDYHIEVKQRNRQTVMNRCDEFFQYFDELSTGYSKPGGVAYSLNQDDAFKALAFDLLYDGKFRNWRDIRALKNIYDNEEARDRLRLAAREEDIEEGKTRVEEAVNIAGIKRADKRTLGANTRIATFVKWLEELPVNAFKTEIKPENLRRLLSALELVRSNAEEALKEKEERVEGE